jgi:hypothetical protein
MGRPFPEGNDRYFVRKDAWYPSMSTTFCGMLVRN